MAWKPDPHSLFTPNAGFSRGIPVFNSTCLGINAPSDDDNCTSKEKKNYNHGIKNNFKYNV